MRAEAISKDKRLFRGLTIFVVFAAVIAVVVPAWSAPSRKQYAIETVPVSAQGGQATTLQIKLTNLTASQVAGSANVTLPSAFTNVGSPTTPTVFDGSGNQISKTWTATVVGNTIELRNPGPSGMNALSQGQNVRVSVSVTTPCAPATYTIPVDVKQSNDFNGTGNDLTGPDATLTVTSGCAHHLAFTSNPPVTGAVAGQAMTPVTVEVQDAANNLVSVTGLGVTICISNGSGGCSTQTLYGTTSGTTTNGSVTFSGLIIAQDTPDRTYSFLAQATSDPPADAVSGAFVVAGTAVACDNGPCASNFGDPENAVRGNLSGRVTVNNSTACADCFLTMVASPLESTDCNGGPCRTSITFLYVPPQNAVGAITLFVTCDKKDCPGTGVPNIPLYLEKPGQPDILLENCSSTNGTPCIDHRSRTGVGDIQWTVLVDKDDPRPKC